MEYDDVDVYYLLTQIKSVEIQFPVPLLRLHKWDSPRKMRIVVARRNDFTGFLLVKTFQLQ